MHQMKEACRVLVIWSPFREDEGYQGQESVDCFTWNVLPDPFLGLITITMTTYLLNL